MHSDNNNNDSDKKQQDPEGGALRSNADELEDEELGHNVPNATTENSPQPWAASDSAGEAPSFGDREHSASERQQQPHEPPTSSVPYAHVAKGMDPPTTASLSIDEPGNHPEPDVILPRFKDQVNDVSIQVNAVFPNHIIQRQAVKHANQKSDVSQQTYTSSSEETPFADVRLLTHSILFENPHILEVDAAPEELPIDASVLTTGFAEEQFPPQATRRPAFVTVTIIKPTIDTVTGVCLSTDGASGCVYISGFKDNAALSRVLALSPLGVGDKILSVNERPCAGLKVLEIIELIRSVSGPVTIAIENVSGDPSLVETMVEKETAESKVGLGFNYTFQDGGYIQVSRVSGMFANSFVEVGDRVVLVNGEKPRSVAAVMDLIARSIRFVSVTVESRTGVVLPVDGTDENGNREDEPNSRRNLVQTSTPSTDVASCSCCIL